MTDLNTPLYQEHVALKGRMVSFGGWAMPVQYSAGLMTEHECVRTRVGLFDVSHMGEFLISGNQARPFLNRVTTNNVDLLVPQKCQYTMLCYPNGTVVDDLILSQLAENKYIAVVNASNVKKDFDWLVSNNKEGADLTNISDQKSLIAIQGPRSQELLNQSLGHDFSGVGYYHLTEIKFKGIPLTVFRTGYTGEDGFEVMSDNQHASAIWRLLLENGARYQVLPIGLGARDTLRLEAAYSLYGHEISDAINPIEAKLGWAVKFEKGPFTGSDVLLKEKKDATRKVMGFEVIEPGIAREGYTVHNESEQVGFVTSGTHSPTLKKAIGLALLKTAEANIDNVLFVDIRGKKKKIRLIKTPFYKREKPV
ncbi:MAG: glycine cleavage system aminomethyltransferase GcvT [Deltaproteobacteria bacterium]|nr:glycine cleavage system aminomethyltransferase GcvT [Deltaproteobacteria bacterium]